MSIARNRSNQLRKMSERNPTHQKPSFDEFGFEENGVMYWWASWYGDIMGYKNPRTFQSPVDKAIQACRTLDLNPSDNFIETRRREVRRSFRDYKLTRFACYLVAMNADARKPVVARAQVYFAEQIERINLMLEGSKDIERLLIREEIKEGHHHLTAAAAKAGVRDFRFFMTEGYIGLYNKPIREVKMEKGVDPGDNLYEYMSRAEMSANLFRITMTEERLRRSRTSSAFEAAAIHKRIGEYIRRMVKDHTGHFPEELPTERNLNQVSSELKKAGKLLNERKGAEEKHKKQPGP